MNARLNERGELWLDRIGNNHSKEKRQTCPFQEGRGCGDDCPMFQVAETKGFVGGGKVDIMIGCRGSGEVLTVDKFIDQRPGGKDR